MRTLTIKTLLSLFLLLSCITVSQATVYYVDGSKPDNTGIGTSWATAKKDVQNAINACTANGDEVWVKAGTYVPTIDPSGGTNVRNKTFCIQTYDIKLYGGFSGVETNAGQRNTTTNATILSGDIDGVAGNANNAYHVLLILNRTAACVIDGFTITDGNATNGSPTNVGGLSISRNSGGGMYNHSSSLTVSNCKFTGNTTSYRGGGMHNYSSSPTVTNCVFTNNLTNDGGSGMYNIYSNSTVSNCVFSGNSSDGSGGGMYNYNSNPTVSNCVFSNNSAYGGGGIYNTIGSPTVTNCVFSNNSTFNNGGGGMYNNSGSATVSNCVFSGNVTPEDGGGISLYSFSNITNCIFWNNTTGNATDANREEIFVGTASGTPITVSNCIVRDYSSTAPNNYAATNISTSNPLFVNGTNAIGPDGIWMTADDGLQLTCNSPAKDAGTGTIPTTDILGNPRIGAMDIGAYEMNGSNTAASNTIPSALASALLSQMADIVHYSDCANEICAIDATTPYTLNGNTTATVYVQATASSYNSQPYVRRYYNISPASNASTATASVTLYFTQADFDNFNSNNGSYPDLPTDASDNTGISNLRVTQMHGNSSTGLPGSYSGSNVLITPTTVMYNTVASRWEITFTVAGFSGFFVHTGTNMPLPLQLLSFTAKTDDNVNHLYWNMANDAKDIVFNIQRSDDGKSFEKIGTQQGGKINYTFNDEQAPSSISYYRLQMSENGGLATMSNTIILRRSGKGNIKVAPVPAKDYIEITNTDAILMGTEASIYDMQGSKTTSFRLQENLKINIASWTPGIYMLRLSDGSIIKLVKQ